MLQKIKIKTSFRNLPDFQAAAEVVRTLRDHGKKAFFAGGSVRDILLGKAPHDIDITTSALPGEVMTIFPKNHAVGAAFGVIIVHHKGFQFETATLREERGYSDGRRPDQVFYTENEQTDVERRDFTINGMLYDPLTDEVLDYVGGLSDLHAGVIRTIGDPERRFHEDFLRMLRAVRFKTRFGFILDAQAAEAIRKMAPDLTRLSVERIRTELEKMLTGPHPADAFETMLSLGMLQFILPEAAVMNGCTQQPDFHPEGDVFRHTMIMLEKMAHPTLELAWSVLLHDIGKPRARTVRNGIIHFYGHEAVGAGMAEEILTRLKASASLIKNVSAAVAGHMRFSCVDKMRRSTWRKLMASPTFPTEMELHRIDCSSCHGLLQNYVLMLDRYSESGNTPVLPDPFLNGNDLLRMGISAGPKIGMILNTVRDFQLDGSIRSRKEALKKAEELKKSL